MSDETADPGALEERLAVRFHDRTLLERALTHRSYAFENDGSAHNERLEFLGDAVLGLAVTDHIFHRHDDAAEGRLAKLRAAAVKTGSLAKIARQYDLGRYMRLGKGEASSGGHDKDSILADGLEAVIGAYYLDQGYDEAAELVVQLFGDQLEELADEDAVLDYKTELQELAAARFEELPSYETRDTGPDHDKTFTAEVSVNGQVRGTGTGASKKQAEQRAAREAYELLIDDRPADSE
ncbi:MAG: ribonuclease III [Nitriliruptorales bacterium]|nr:ribonuclease III [Nitriliruptorales bacterium]